MENNILDKITNDSLDSVKEVIKYAEIYKLTNSQKFLNYLDSLNQLSVKY